MPGARRCGSRSRKQDREHREWNRRFGVVSCRSCLLLLPIFPFLSIFSNNCCRCRSAPTLSFYPSIPRFATPFGRFPGSGRQLPVLIAVENRIDKDSRSHPHHRNVASQRQPGRASSKKPKSEARGAKLTKLLRQKAGRGVELAPFKKKKKN